MHQITATYPMCQILPMVGNNFRILLHSENTITVMILVLAGADSGGQDETTIQPPPTPRKVQHENCSTLQCQESFSCTTVENTSLCLPVCGRWELFSHPSTVALNVTIGLSAAISIIASIAVLVISCIRWKQM